MMPGATVWEIDWGLLAIGVAFVMGIAVGFCLGLYVRIDDEPDSGGDDDRIFGSGV